MKPISKNFRKFQISKNEIMLFCFSSLWLLAVTKVIDNKIRDLNIKIGILAHLLLYHTIGPHN